MFIIIFQIPAFEEHDFMALNNMGNTCFGNAPAQLFFRMWKEDIVNYAGENGIVKALQDLAFLRERDVKKLIKQVEGE